jgi:hypothetical protein
MTNIRQLACRANQAKPQTSADKPTGLGKFKGKLKKTDDIKPPHDGSKMVVKKKHRQSKPLSIDSKRKNNSGLYQNKTQT